MGEVVECDQLGGIIVMDSHLEITLFFQLLKEHEGNIYGLSPCGCITNKLLNAYITMEYNLYSWFIKSLWLHNFPLCLWSE